MKFSQLLEILGPFVSEKKAIPIHQLQKTVPVTYERFNVSYFFALLMCLLIFQIQKLDGLTSMLKAETARLRFHEENDLKVRFKFLILLQFFVFQRKIGDVANSSDPKKGRV